MFDTGERLDSAAIAFTTTLQRVNKRNGSAMPFDSRKIMRAIVKAGT